jgi:hypothetical protein
MSRGEAVQATRGWEQVPKEDRGSAATVATAVALAALIPTAIIFPVYALAGSLFLALGGLLVRRRLIESMAARATARAVARAAARQSQPALGPETAVRDRRQKQEAAA